MGFLTRRNADLREILDGDARALPADGSLTLPEAQETILAGLERLEEKTGAARRIADLVLDVALSRGRDGAARILEIGAGSGGLTCRLWRRARERGIAARLASSDLDPEAVDRMRRRFKEEGVPCEARILDARDLSSEPDGAWDAVFSVYTLHHIPSEDLAVCFREMDRVSGGGMVAVDLPRSYFTIALGLSVWLLCGGTARRLLLRDGIVSVRRAYKAAEIEALLAGAAISTKYRVGPFPTAHPVWFFGLTVLPKGFPKATLAPDKFGP